MSSSMVARGVPGIDYLDDCADEAIATCPTMAGPCVDCAFTPGTGAYANPITSAMATECVDARHLFWCHKTKDQLDMPTHLCAGWRAALAPPTSAGQSGEKW